MHTHLLLAHKLVRLFYRYIHLASSAKSFNLFNGLAYCTGLLLARRVLKKLEMDQEYEGNVEVHLLLMIAHFLDETV